MKFVNDNFKFVGMRKAQEFTIYPCKADDREVQLQSDTRIMLVNIETGLAILSAPKSNGANFHHLNAVFGAKKISITEEDLERIKAMRDKMSGNTNKDGTIIIVG